MNYRIGIPAAFILTAAVFISSCSQPASNSQKAEAPAAERNDEYSQKLKEGADLVGQENFPKARENFEAALKIAERENNIDDIVSAKTDLANTYAFEQDIANAERLYNEALDDCEAGPGCSPERMDITVGFISFFNLTIAKDAERQEKLIERIKNSKVFAGSGNVKDRVCKHIDRTRSLGFEEAEEWAKRESCPPPVERVNPHSAP